MNVCSMTREDLDVWVKTRAKPGDVALWYDTQHNQQYYYIYKEPDSNPSWSLWFKDDVIEKYLVEINKLKIEDTAVNKRCENCKHWHYGGLGVNISFCKHDDQVGILVPKFTCCDKHELKEERSTPFDNMKFYLKDASTGELDIRYACEECGMLEDKPFHWWFALPIYTNGKPTKKPGFHFRCEACEKKIRENKK